MSRRSATSLRSMKCRGRGITMVESLVALVVLSVGMLGIASLYVSSLSAGRSALLRTQAVNLASDMSDRIRANPLGRGAYNMSAYSADEGEGPAAGSCVVTQNCTAEQLAEDDLARWNSAVLQALPGAGMEDGVSTANVQYTAGAGTGLPDRYVIQVQWRGPGDLQPQSYRANLELIPANP